MLPTHDLNWRGGWERITSLIETALKAEEPDAEEVIELLRQRQRLLSAVKRVDQREISKNIPEQLDWLQVMQERDAGITREISELLENKTRSLESYRANKRALKMLRRKSISPQRHYIVTGHL